MDLTTLGLNSGKLLRAVLSGVAVFITGIAVYQVPPDFAHLYQPAIQGALAFLTSLGLTAAAKRSE